MHVVCNNGSTKLCMYTCTCNSQNVQSVLDFCTFSFTFTCNYKNDITNNKITFHHCPSHNILFSQSYKNKNRSSKHLEPYVKTENSNLNQHLYRNLSNLDFSKYVYLFLSLTSGKEVHVQVCNLIPHTIK